MATSNYSINVASGWTEVADTTDDFIIEVRDPDAEIKVTLQSSTPAADAAYHIVTKQMPFIRAGCTGKAYIAVTNPTSENVNVIVSI